jgi:ubiquinone/menaquinone biosynthesis C-methylase UbiE
MKKTNYNKIAKTYDKRYATNYLVNIENNLKNIISTKSCKKILEVGCGTGRWINALKNNHLKVFGLDYSLEMLKISKTNGANLKVVNADAVKIPFKKNIFDLIFCINAFHHFSDKDLFLKECTHALKQSGYLAIYGVDPHIDKEWYVYDYFDSVYENDLKRFITIEELKVKLKENHFTNIKVQVVEKIFNERVGVEVFNDPFLDKNHSSQLANLSNKEYEAGIKKIKNKILRNPQKVFTTLVIFYLVIARKEK